MYTMYIGNRMKLAFISIATNKSHFYCEGARLCLMSHSLSLFPLFSLCWLGAWQRQTNANSLQKRWFIENSGCYQCRWMIEDVAFIDSFFVENWVRFVIRTKKGLLLYPSLLLSFWIKVLCHGIKHNGMGLEHEKRVDNNNKKKFEKEPRNDEIIRSSVNLKYPW